MGLKEKIQNLISDTIRVKHLYVDGNSIIGGLLLGALEAVDLNGIADALVIDADGDTTISSPTDDQIDIEINGADDFRLTPNKFTALSGSVIETNTVNETTADAGVTVDGVLIKDSAVTTDTINEKTPAAGVTIDGVKLKDGVIDAPQPSQVLTASGAITINNGLVVLNHATVIIAATLDAPVRGDDLTIVDGSASGTAAHTVTLPAGVTFDGTNNTATLNAPNEALHIRALSATRWFILENIGSVALSNV
jgi:hypothetical protein